MEKLTDSQKLEIIFNEFHEYKKDWKEYKKEDREHRSKIDIIITRHDEQIKNQDEKLKGIWKLPAAISGIIGTLIAVIGFIINLPTKP
jgi:hypothetical protein